MGEKENKQGKRKQDKCPEKTREAVVTLAVEGGGWSRS